MLPEVREPGFVMLTAVAHPFKVSRDIVMVRAGQSLADMLHTVQPDPILRRHAVIFIDGHVIPRNNWPRVYPKEGTHIEINILPMGQGGGQSGGGQKNVLRVVMMLAVAVASVYTGGAVAAAYGAAYGAAAGAAVSAVGSLLTNVLVAARPQQIGRQDSSSSRVFSIEGTRNRARPNEVVPQVLGRHRVRPDYGAPPVTEIVGDKQYVRLLFVWGIGPLHIDIDSLRIGETPITEFEDIELEHREGWPTDTRLSLYPDSIKSDDLSIKMETGNWVTKVTQPNTDEISLDYTFPEGCWYNFKNQTRGVTVYINIQYRPVGTSTWLSPVPKSLTLGRFSGFTWNTGDLRRKEPFHIGIRFQPSSRGQFEVRSMRSSKDWTVESGRYDDLYLTTLRSIRNEDPIRSRVPVAKTALRIRATDQLNGIVDEFNGVVTSIGEDLVGDVWVPNKQITNPSSLGRLILKGAANPYPLVDRRLDDPRWREFHSWCVINKFKFNQIRDYSSSVWDALLDCLAAGRATPGEPDGKLAPIIDKPQPFRTSHITPRNSYDFSVEKTFVDWPHAFRINFPNEREGYRIDERRVYVDGHDSSTATRFDALEFPGVTDPDLIWTHGRYRLAQGKLQPEKFSFKQDMEFLTYQRGDRVALTHDVLLIGTAEGRIKEALVDEDNNVLGVIVDEELEMEAGSDYGLAIRTLYNAHITRKLITVAGKHTEVMFETVVSPIDGEPAIQRKNIFGFGFHGFETDSAQILSIHPDNNTRASIVAVPYRDDIYTADEGDIPPFQTNLTGLPDIPAPIITGVISNEAALAIGEAGVLRSRVMISVKPLDSEWLRGAYLEVQGRFSGFDEPYRTLNVDESTLHGVVISDVRDGETWDYRLRFVVADRSFPGPWVHINKHTIIGKSTPPAGLTGLTISVFGDQAFMRWDKPSDLDVLYGGEVRFRHSVLLTGATWAGSVSIGTSSRSSDLMATLPLKPGTYLARVFDVTDRPSVDIVSVTTKQASVLTWAAAGSLDEDPVFSGSFDRTLVDSGALKLDTAGEFDAIADLDELLDDMDAFGGVLDTGEYTFFNGFDFGSTVKRRLTTRITAASFNVLVDLDERGQEVDSWEDWDGDTQGATDAVIYVRHTDTDPTVSPVWSAWERLESAVFEARAFQFKVMLSSSDPAFNMHIFDLGVDAAEVVT